MEVPSSPKLPQPEAAPPDFLRLARLVLGLSREFQRVLEPPLTAELGLGIKELFVLRAVELGHVSPSAIAAFLTMAPPSVSRMLDALERAAMLERTLDEEDRRRFLFRVTAAGKKAAQEARALAAATLSARYARADQRQLQEAIRMLENLAAQLGEG